MHYRGINYDVGINSRAGTLSRKEFDADVIGKEIDIISADLKCNAIRIYGYDISRLVTASECALKNNLTVFFSPYNINATHGGNCRIYSSGRKRSRKVEGEIWKCRIL